MDIREVFARNLRHHRHAAGLSQEELAHRAEIDRTYISALERCVYAAGIDIVDRLARAIGVEAADLLQRTPPEATTGIETASASFRVSSIFGPVCIPSR